MLKRVSLAVTSMILVAICGGPVSAATAPETRLVLDCAYTSEVRIEFDGDPTLYTLDQTGTVVPQVAESFADLVPEDCVTQGQVVPQAWPSGWKEFKPSSPRFSAYDTNGSFDAQSQNTSMSWSYLVAPHLVSISTGQGWFTATRSPNGPTSNQVTATTASGSHLVTGSTRVALAMRTVANTAWPRT